MNLLTDYCTSPSDRIASVVNAHVQKMFTVDVGTNIRMHTCRRLSTRGMCVWLRMSVACSTEVQTRV